MKKSNFLAFLFAFIPGAGQMYMGYMKRGASLMLAFSGVIAVMAMFNLPVLSMLLPVIWFFAFFDTFNLNGLTYEQRMYTEDKFLFHLDSVMDKNWAALVARRHTLIGAILILLGLNLVYNMLSGYFWEYFHKYPILHSLFDNIPTFLVAVAVIVLGVYLLRSKKNAKKALPEDDFVQYGGEKHDA